jgi:hypothetical protein
MRIDGPQVTSSLSLNGTTITDLNVFVTTGSLNGLTGSYATTGSNLFKGTQTLSGSIIPAVDNTYDLGSVTHQFRDLYLSSASLYIDGTKVLSSTTQELQITTDTGQSFKILEAGSDTITLQSADGNITIATSGGGDVIMDPTTGIIALKGTTTVYSGNKIVASDGNNIHFGDGITVTGSIVSTTTSLVSGSSQITYSGLSGVPIDIISGSGQLTTLGVATTGSNTFNGNLTVTGFIDTQELRTTYISSSILYRSGSTKFGDELTDTHSFTGSILISGSISIPGSNLVSGSSQVLNGSGVFSGSAQLPSGIVSGSAQTIANLPSGVVSGSVQVDVMSTTNIARLATTGSNIFTSNQIVTGSISSTGNIKSEGVLQWNNGIGALSYGGGSVTMETNTATPILLKTNGTTAITISTGQTVTFTGAATFSDRIQITSNGGTNPVLAIRQTNAANQGYDFETEDVSVGRLDLYGVGSGGRVQMMTWLKSNGRVGIGSIAPKTKLQVTPVSNAEVPVLGTATGVAIFTSANTNYGLQFNSTSDGSFHIQSQRFDASATAYNLILNYAGGNIGIGGNTSPGCSLDVSSRTDAIALPRGTTAQRPGSSIAGMGRFNTEISKTEFYNGTVWVAIGGAGDGSTSSSAASSAKAIKAAVGNPTSGVYWLQIPNVNSGNAFQCYCDFTMDGGIGYAIIYNQYFEGPETGPSHANFGSSTISTAGFDTEYQISPTAMVSNYGITKLAVFARTGGSSGGGITGATHFNWVAFSGPTTTQYNTIFTQGFGSTQFTGTFNSSDGNTGTAYFPNSHGNTGGVTQISTNGGTVNDYILYEYKQGTGTDPNHFWMVANGRSGDNYWVANTRYGSSSGNVMYNRWGGVALY